VPPGNYCTCRTNSDCASPYSCFRGLIYDYCI
jgi:hypothetical protein